MPSITIEFESDNAYDELVRCVCVADGYQDEIPDPNDPAAPAVENPQPPEDFVLGRIIGFLSEKLRAVQEQERAADVPPVEHGMVLPEPPPVPEAAPVEESASEATA